LTDGDTIKALHVYLEGFTAFFRVPWSITASQLTLSCPSYANILGLLSACTNKIVRYTDTRIGFEFKHVSECPEIERTDRFQMSGTGKGKYLREHSKGQSILYRQVHFRPQLDLYLTNLDFFDYFNNPVAPLALGRSQDLCWIKKVEVVDLIPVKSGNVGSTMISNRFLKTYLSPEVVRSVEWFDNDIDGVTRKVGNMGFFQVISPDLEHRTNVTMGHLYHPSNLPNKDDVIYLHEWSRPLVRTTLPKKKRSGK
jgi:CRISPR-associated Cas5-like protein